MKGTNLNLTFPLETIYDNANFQLNDTDKVGVVGVNGAGKTTLFKIILKELELDSGKIEVVNKRIGYLPQEINDYNKEILVFDYIMNARPIKKLEKELEKLYIEVSTKEGKEQQKIMKRISKTQSLLEYYDYYNAENAMLELISNLEIDFDLLDLKLTDLSGGQKSKIAFAHLLYSMPEILLLDEPTNHLDVKTREFITNYLKHYKGMVL
ncbi:MAG: ATP-binding cassette domain-containing protein, partial [Bacilli bacterium]